MIKYKGKKVAILGVGVDTKDIVPWLEVQGAVITIVDENARKLEEFEGIFQVKNSLDRLNNFDVIVRNPAVYRFRKEIVEAEKAGVEVTSKTKVFFDICPAKIIGVTGTKGKGTTATLIYEIFKAAGKEVYIGGNIGEGVFHLLPKLKKNSWVVLELSSFQLIDLHKSPRIAVVLMVTSEHLNWHRDEKEYVDAKKSIVAHQKSSDFAIVNKDYPNSVEIGKTARGKVVWVSSKDVGDIGEVKLRGDHNRENIAAAMAVARVVGISQSVVEDTIRNFKGLEHRLEEVRTVNGITFYNDSFSTTPETAIAAVKSFTEPEILILGGSSKNSDFTELGKVVSEAKNIKTVIVIGDEGPKIAKSISGVMVKEGVGGMEKIVDLAYNQAKSGDVVILSPACASFDMFKNYKDRGEQFKAAIKKLKVKS